MFVLFSTERDLEAEENCSVHKFGKGELKLVPRLGYFFSSDKLFGLLSFIDKSGEAAVNCRLNDVVAQEWAHVPIFSALELHSAGSSPLHQTFNLLRWSFRQTSMKER